MIFAAGLGSRLKPLTDTMPKAMVPIAGHPMLEHVILKLKAAGFTEIVINIHHFGDQILDFLKVNENFGLTIHISDERDLLLDTGGGVKKARSFFENSDEPFLIHNVDILSDVNLKELYDYHYRVAVWQLYWQADVKPLVICFLMKRRNFVAGLTRIRDR